LIYPRERIRILGAGHQVVSTVLVVERSEEGKPTASRDWYILSVKFFLQQDRGIHTIKNSHIVSLQQHKNCDSTLWCTQL
jgi:hypothetical protein